MIVNLTHRDDAMTTTTNDPAKPFMGRKTVTAADRARARLVLRNATDENLIPSERTAAWLRLTAYAERAGTDLSAFLAAHVLPFRAGQSLDALAAEADRLATLAGEAIGERDVAMLKAAVKFREAVRNPPRRGWKVRMPGDGPGSEAD